MSDLRPRHENMFIRSYHIPQKHVGFYGFYTPFTNEKKKGNKTMLIAVVAIVVVVALIAVVVHGRLSKH